MYRLDSVSWYGFRFNDENGNSILVDKRITDWGRVILAEEDYELEEFSAYIVKEGN